MLSKILLASAMLFSTAAYSNIIPLDSYGGKTWVLSTEGEGKVLSGFVGRATQWKVRPDSKTAISKALGIPTGDPWREYFRIAEDMPFNAVNDPSQRLWNLPELLDRLSLENQLPLERVEIVSSDDRQVTIIVKQPTIIAASVSTYRNVHIINKSKLLLMCPLCKNVSVENTSKESQLDLYSYICFDSPKKGQTTRYKLGDWISPCREQVEVIEPNSLLSGTSWLPQIIISQLMGRTPSELFELWNQLYKISL